MAGAAVFSLMALPRLAQPAARLRDPQRAPIGRDLAGLAAVLAAVAAGAWITQHFLGPVAGWLLSPWGGRAAADGSLMAKWVDLVALLMGAALTLPLAMFAARRVRFETLLSGLEVYFRQPQAWSFLGFIVLYKLTDVFALSLQTSFLLKGVGFAPAEIGVVNKLFGMGLTVFGALLGGALMLRLRLARALLVFGVLQMVCNAGFWWLAVHGKGALPGWTMPAIDFGFVRLAQPTPIDGGLLMAVATQNLSSGMGTAAILALLMALVNRRFSATQYALLSAFASIGPVWVGPIAGVLVEAIGWPAFFAISITMGLPSLLWLPRLWKPIEALDPR
jgi:PAT family beta-lactamase induction signal transducer AmpG